MPLNKEIKPNKIKHVPFFSVNHMERVLESGLVN